MPKLPTKASPLWVPEEDVSPAVTQQLEEAWPQGRWTRPSPPAHCSTDHSPRGTPALCMETGDRRGSPSPQPARPPRFHQAPTDPTPGAGREPPVRGPAAGSKGLGAQPSPPVREASLVPGPASTRHCGATSCPQGWQRARPREKPGQAGASDARRSGCAFQSEALACQDGRFRPILEGG